MPDTKIVPQPDPTAAEILRRMADSQQRMALNLRELGTLLGAPQPEDEAARLRARFRQHLIDPAPVSPARDECDCEICGRFVPLEQRSGFAARHGATVHCNCLTAQMEASR